MSDKKVTLKNVAAGRKDRYEIDPRIIKRKEGFNTRMDFGDIEGLAQSILEIGIKNPLKVYIEEGEVFLIDGDRRLTAVEMLISRGNDIKTVPCISGKWTEEERVFDLLVSGDGKPLTDLEAGHAYLRLVNFGYDQIEISKKVGRNQATISDCIALARTSKRIQTLLVEGKTTKSAVMEVLRTVKDEDEQYNLLVKTMEENTTGRRQGRATLDGVRSRLGEKRQTATLRVKNLTAWLNEKENSFVGNERFGILQAVMNYIGNGQITMESLLVELSLVEKSDGDSSEESEAVAVS